MPQYQDYDGILQLPNSFVLVTVMIYGQLLCQIIILLISFYFEI